MPKQRYNAAKRAKKRKGFCGRKLPSTSTTVNTPVNNLVDSNTPTHVNIPVDNAHTVNIQSDTIQQTSTSSLSFAAPPRPLPVLPSSSLSSTLPAPTLSPPISTPVPKNSSQPFMKKVINKSQEKLKNSCFKSKFAGRTRLQTTKLGIRRPKVVIKAHSNKVIGADILKSSVSGMICGKCRSGKSKFDLLQVPDKQKGLCETLMWKCLNCLSTTTFQTSERCTKSSINCFDINLRSVIASQQMGQSGLRKFCGIMNMATPVLTNSFNKIQTKVHDKVDLHVSEALNEATKRLFHLIKMEEPENIDTHDDGKEYVNVAVTVDGTWQRRGHTSKNGAVFIISARTGEVLDYVVKTLHCQRCVFYKNKFKDDNNEFQKWYIDHKENCYINHHGSSDSMETQGVKEMFLRSMDRRLKYTTFIGDGDSSSYGVTAEACFEKYGENYLVIKEECVGHIQKRLGSRLRELKRKRQGTKLNDGKGVGGKGRLTEKVMDKMQNFFGQSIRKNSGDKKSMSNDIWAIFEHMIIDEGKSLKEQHSRCPKDDWCKFWTNRENYSENNRLPFVFRELLKPIFNDLTKDELLKRCLLGFTQNQNEAFNGILWGKCPKTKFAGLKKLEIAVGESILEWNTGAVTKASLLDAFTSVGTNSLIAFRKLDDDRVKNADRKVSAERRLERRKQRGAKKSKGDTTTTSYLTGSFGLGKEPELGESSKTTKTAKSKPTTKKITSKKQPPLSSPPPPTPPLARQSPPPSTLQTPIDSGSSNSTEQDEVCITFVSDSMVTWIGNNINRVIC